MPEIRVTKHGGYKYGVGDDRKHYGKGQTIIAKQKDARMLVAAKLAEYVEDGKEVKAKAKTSTRAVRAAPKTAARKGSAGAKKGTYDRRDMRAK